MTSIGSIDSRMGGDSHLSGEPHSPGQVARPGEPPRTDDLPVESSSEEASQGLAPQLDPKWALRWQHLATAAFFATFYVLVSYLPLHHLVSWRHVAIGREILATGQLPRHELHLPLAEGIEAPTFSWLSQVFWAWAYRLGEGQGVTTLLSIAHTATVVLVGVLAWQRSNRRRFAILAAAALILSIWPMVTIARPEVFGLLCFCGLLAIVHRYEEANEEASEEASEFPIPISKWVAVLGLVVLWANLDGSVVFGVGALALIAVGCVVDARRRASSWLAVFEQASVRHAIYLAEAAFIASLFQPNGIVLWGSALGGNNSWLWSTTGGFQPLVLVSLAGGLSAIVWIAAAVLLRLTRRPISTADVLLLGASFALAAIHVGWMPWFVAVACFVLIPHAATTLSETGWLRPKVEPLVFEAGKPAPPLAFAYSLLTVLLLWIAFSVTPASNFLLGGKARNRSSIHSPQTPLAVADFLADEKQPAIHGLVWHPEGWGDWLGLASDGKYSLALNSHFRAIPARVLLDAASVGRADANWSKTLDRYAVDVLIVDRERQPRLAEAVFSSSNADWKIVYEDKLAIILRRKEG